VTVSPAAATLRAGATLQLAAATLDASGQPIANQTVTWTSSDAGVATVSVTGLVTAVAEGAATMTATTAGVSGTAEITVGDAQASPEAIRVTRILFLRDSLARARSPFRLGLSVGMRITQVRRFDYAIDPVTHNVLANELADTDLLLSGVVATRLKYIRDFRLDAIASLDLATFTAASLAAVNKPIEGGIGFALVGANRFSLGYTLDVSFARFLRDPSYVGRRIVVNADTLTTLDLTDNGLFYTRTYFSTSLRFIFFF